MSFDFKLGKTYKMIKMDDSEITFQFIADYSGHWALIDNTKIDLYKFINTPHKRIILLD